MIVASGVRPAVECALDTPIHVDRFIQVSDTMETNCPNIYAAGRCNRFFRNLAKCNEAGTDCCAQYVRNTGEYTDRYAMKNTMNFYGLVTLSLGRGVAEEGDIVLEEEDAHNYRRAIIRDGKLDSILLQGKLTIPVFISI